MNAYHFTHLSLLALGGGIEGRTRLQNAIFFIRILAGNSEDLGYWEHFYGPYSDEVAAAVNRLKSLAFVQQTTIGSEPWSEGFETVRLKFELTEEGWQVALTKAHQNPQAWQKIEGAAKRLRDCAEIGYMTMCLAAKTYFAFYRDDQPLARCEYAEAVKTAGWQPRREEVQNSLAFLKHLGLADRDGMMA
jgi:uncharacterized protein YwgA